MKDITTQQLKKDLNFLQFHTMLAEIAVKLKHYKNGSIDYRERIVVGNKMIALIKEELERRNEAV